MDKDNTIYDLKEMVRIFCEERDWNQFHNPKDLSIGISTEANELLQLFRFKSKEDMEQMMKSEKKNDVEDELADVLYFVLRMAQMNDIDLYTAVKRKINKNNKKYPIEKARGNNKKYNEYK